MKRLIVAVIIIIFVIGISSAAHFVFLDKTQNLAETLSRAKSYAENSDFAAMALAADELMSTWEKDLRIMSLILSHHNLKDLTVQIAGLENLQSSGNTDLYIEAIEEAQKELEFIVETEKFHIGNIF